VGDASALTHDIDGGALGKTGIQEQIDEILADSKGPYYDARHPQHAAMVDKVPSSLNNCTSGRLAADRLGEPTVRCTRKQAADGR